MEEQINDQESSLTFWEHLEVLRWSIFRVAIVVFVAMIVLFIAMPQIFTAFVLGPTTSEFFLYRWLSSLGSLPFMPDFSAGDFKADIININVASQFLIHISTSFWFALIVAFPYLVYNGIFVSISELTVNLHRLREGGDSYLKLELCGLIGLNRVYRLMSEGIRRFDSNRYIRSECLGIEG